MGQSARSAGNFPNAQPARENEKAVPSIMGALWHQWPAPRHPIGSAVALWFVACPGEVSARAGHRWHSWFGQRAQQSATRAHRQHSGAWERTDWVAGQRFDWK